MSIASFGITRWTKWDSSSNATGYTYMYYSTMQQKLLRFGAAATKQLLQYPLISIQTWPLHARGWQSYSSRFSPSTYFHTLCLCISAGHCHLSHCEGLLLNEKSLVRLVSLCCWCGSSLFYFLVFFLPADHLCFLFLFFNTGFSSWALIPRCLCCVSSSVSVELLVFLNPLPACLCFFPASHWRAVKHRANFVPQNYFSFTVQTLPPNCCLVLMLHIITSA